MEQSWRDLGVTRRAERRVLNPSAIVHSEETKLPETVERERGSCNGARRTKIVELEQA